MSSEPPPTRNRLPAPSAIELGLFAAALLIDGFALAAFADAPALSQYPVLEGTLLHSLACVLGAACFLRTFPPGYVQPSRRPTALALFAAFALALPLLGLLTLGIVRAILSLPRAHKEESQFVIGDSPVLTDVVLAPRPDRTRPPRAILDILHGDEVSERRRAVLSLRVIDPKKAIPVLQKAIQDSDEQVRLLAQAQFNKILSGLEFSIKTLEAEIAASPPTPERLARLAEYYHELVYLGLASEESEVIYLDRAIQLLEQLLTLDPNDRGARFDLMKLCIKKRDTAAAKRCLEHLQKAGFQHELLFPWQADLLFQTRDWPGLVQCLHELRQREVPDVRLRSLCEFWLGPEPSPPDAKLAHA